MRSHLAQRAPQAFITLLFTLAGCGALVTPAPRDAARDDGRVVPATPDARADAAIDPPGADAAPPDAPAPDLREFPLTDTQAACLGLTRPACAGCHRRGDRWVLLPVGVPPSPPGIEPPNYAACGVMR